MGSALPAEEGETLVELALRVTNATLADDGVLTESTFAELSAFCEGLLEKYGEHPEVLETLADYTPDAKSRAELYRRASLSAAAAGRSLHTIHLSWAGVLLEDLREPRMALTVLRECRENLERYADASDRSEYLELYRRAAQGAGTFRGCETDALADQAFQQLVRQSGLSEDEFLTSVMESVSGKKVSEDVWEPLVR